MLYAEIRQCCVQSRELLSFKELSTPILQINGDLTAKQVGQEFGVVRTSEPNQLSLELALGITTEILLGTNKKND